MMFKIVVLQRIYHLSDPQAEYQIRDRLLFRDFLGLASGDKVPDEKTIWAFKEELTKKGLLGQLFNEFYAFLEENNLILHEGTMIDGSFVEAPRQHNTREENKIIMEDRGGELWNPEGGDTEEEKRHKANKKRQKDTDVRWVKKGGETHFGMNQTR
ncbi:MAG: transposase [Bacteroidales bacterium]|nr:transposase [Bacteroidales bacterium]